MKSHFVEMPLQIPIYFFISFYTLMRKQVKDTGKSLKLRQHQKSELNHSSTEKHAGGVCYVPVFQTCRLLLLFQIIASFDVGQVRL